MPRAGTETRAQGLTLRPLLIRLCPSGSRCCRFWATSQLCRGCRYVLPYKFFVLSYNNKAHNAFGVAGSWLFYDCKFTKNIRNNLWLSRGFLVIL
uniref:Uncharacterized protein n=1 Tax=virus sp. ctoYX9 TaxID=2825822 RepID=A0A8S5RPJ1_9VIRU|nr:MAG TPA: hypothetical protein [virus sp. ctoYX9]